MGKVLSIVDSHSPDFQEIFNRSYHQVARTAYYVLGDWDSAKDIAQEVFVKLWSMDLSSIEKIDAYLTTTAQNMALDHYRKEKALSERHDIFLDLSSSYTQADEELISERIQKLKKNMMSLAPQCRLVFSLSRFDGLTNQEIADHLSISKRTVETQITTALKQLRNSN